MSRLTRRYTFTLVLAAVLVTLLAAGHVEALNCASYPAWNGSNTYAAGAIVTMQFNTGDANPYSPAGTNGSTYAYKASMAINPANPSWAPDQAYSVWCPLKSDLTCGNGGVAADPCSGSATATPTATPVATATSTATPTQTAANLADPSFSKPSSNVAETTGSANRGFELNPTYAYADDGTNYASDINSGANTSTSCTDTGKDRHQFYNFSLNIPSGATLKGFEVKLDAWADSTANAPMMCVQLSWDGGTTWTAAKNTATLSTAHAIYVLGTSSDLWGHAWTVTETNNTNFRLRVINVASVAATRDFYLEWVGVKPTFENTSTNGIGSIISSAQFDTIWPPATRAATYTYADFVTAQTNYFPGLGGTGDTNTKIREIAAYFANKSQETGRGQFDKELYCQPGGGGYGTTACNYCDTGWTCASNGNQACASGQQYWGRHSIQLSWNYNYCKGGDYLSTQGGTVNLHASPNDIFTNKVTGWRLANWYWMTQTGPTVNNTMHNWAMTTAHDAITVTNANGYGFGATIRAINGGIECEPSLPVNTIRPQQQLNRIAWYSGGTVSGYSISPAPHIAAPLETTYSTGSGYSGTPILKVLNYTGGAFGDIFCSDN